MVFDVAGSRISRAGVIRRHFGRWRERRIWMGRWRCCVSNSWLHVRDSRQYGPYSLQEVKQKLAAGRFGPTDSFFRRGGQVPIGVQALRREIERIEIETSGASHKYFVFDNGGQLGPYSQSELKEKIDAKAVSADAHVLRDDWRETVAVWRLAQFALAYIELIRRENLDRAGFVDLNGDGRIDSRMVDTDGDGRVDAIMTDVNGDGKFDSVIADLNGDGLADTLALDTDGDGDVDAVAVDSDHDGDVDEIYCDDYDDGDVDEIDLDSY